MCFYSPLLSTVIPLISNAERGNILFLLWVYGNQQKEYKRLMELEKK